MASGPIGSSYKSDARVLLLQLMVTARNCGIRREVDKVLVQATRWLKLHPGDAVVYAARNELRGEFLPAP